MAQISGGSRPATVIDGTGYSTSTSSFAFAGLGSSGGPKAYLNWLGFDRNFILLDMGYGRLSATPREYGQNAPHELLSGSVTIGTPGYVYVYLSNEEATQVEVYFDDFKVEHVKSPVIQSQDYYSFGLSFNSYNRENSVPNFTQYNGKELQDELDLAWLDYGWRMYQPEVGRWYTIDALAQSYYNQGPYNYVANEPVGHTDPDGRWIKGKDGNAVTWTVSEDGRKIKVSDNARKRDVKTINRLWGAGNIGQNALYKFASAQAQVKIKINGSRGASIKSSGSFRASDGQSYAKIMRVTIGVGGDSGERYELEKGAVVTASHVQDEKVRLDLSGDELNDAIDAHSFKGFTKDVFSPWPDPPSARPRVKEDSWYIERVPGGKSFRQIQIQQHIQWKNESLQRRAFRPAVEDDL